uniref:hypothetical protein n=1 Tax=Rhodoplanes serenus TaxID=200615 RepID=UPI001331974F|nr:hypothetical protein [Rhodoplanes serenus]
MRLARCPRHQSWGQRRCDRTPAELAALPLPVIKDILVKAATKWALDKLGLQ